jgi:hypothetical protein
MDRTNMSDEHLIDDKAWAATEPLLPKVYAGARRQDDRLIFDALVGAVPNDKRSIDSTSIKVQCLAPGGKGGACQQAIGRFRGGRTTKIHGIIDSQGRLFRFRLTQAISPTSRQPTNWPRNCHPTDA